MKGTPVTAGSGLRETIKATIKQEAAKQPKTRILTAFQVRTLMLARYAMEHHEAALVLDPSPGEREECLDLFNRNLIDAETSTATYRVIVAPRGSLHRASLEPTPPRND